MGTGGVVSDFIINNFDLRYDEDSNFKRIVRNIIYDAIDEKWFDFTREFYIEDHLKEKFGGDWYAKIYGYDGKEEKNKISFNYSESNIIVFHRIIEEGGFLTNPQGEYFYIKRRSGSDCFIF